MFYYHAASCGLFNRNIIKNKNIIIKLTIVFCAICMLIIGIQTFQEPNRRKRFHELKLHPDLKFVLLWTPSDIAPLDYFNAQKLFIEKNCTWSNCYVTDDRDFFNGNITKFHAVVFNGRNIKKINISEIIPRYRSPHQKFVYVNSEPWLYYPILVDSFNGFFNWTMTYKLDSDILYPYVLVRNKSGDIVGPKVDMVWENMAPGLDEDTLQRIKHKTKAAAWFVSNCPTPSRRERYVKKLRRALSFYNYDVDIYGECGNFNCSREHESNCDVMLERDYFFYLSFENTLARDYVSEKVLRPLRYNTVPVVLGTANYSRFLPPGSYLDAYENSPWKIAILMKDLIRNPILYQSYFRWKNKYSFPMHDPMTAEGICAFCAALNNKEMFEKYSVVEDIKKWWNERT